MEKTKVYLTTPLPSTGLFPHVSVASDKSTPGRKTNHAVMIILPFHGKRIAMPLDAPLVYEMDENKKLKGGSGEDLADQVVDCLKSRLGFGSKQLHYIRGSLSVRRDV